MTPYAKRDIGQEYQTGILDTISGAFDLWKHSGMGLLNPNNPAYKKTPQPKTYDDVRGLLDDPDLEYLPSLDPGGLMRGTMKVFHGSPHLFDRWDFSKMGSGEGAQAYGHGGYFGGSKYTGREYQRDLARNEPKALYKGEDPEDYWKGYRDVDEDMPKHISNAISDVTSIMKKTGQNAEDALKTHFKEESARIKEYRNRAKEEPYWDRVADDAQRQNLIEKKYLKAEDFEYIPPSKGHLYEVELKPDAEDFPEYNIPLNEQPRLLGKFNAAKEKLKTAKGPEKAKLEKALGLIDPKRSIEDHQYGRGVKWNPAAEVSEAFSTIGIPGHRVPNHKMQWAEHRGQPYKRTKRGYNYIVYPTDDPTMIDIKNPPDLSGNIPELLEGLLD